MTDQGSRGPKALLDDYAAIAAKRGPAVTAMATRTGSPAYLDLLAHMASHGRHDLDGVLREVGSEAPHLAPRWTSALGRVLALRARTQEDRLTASKLLSHATPLLKGENRRHAAKYLCELHYAMGNFREARAVIDENPALERIDEGYLLTDLLNPYTASPYADRDAWIVGLNRLFTTHGLEPVAVSPEATMPFDGLRASATMQRDDGPLISVVMTTFEPTRSALLTSVRSILAQSWTNLELIVVDDCSQSPHVSQLLDEIAAMDPRVRVARMPENGGTYVARNAGLALSNGEYFTGQDDDDWSHPRRLERQVEPLISDPLLPATRSQMIAVRPDLVVQRLGYRGVSPNASSAMYRTQIIAELGGFIPTRKASDTELFLRVQRYMERDALTIEQPLSFVRIRPDSLSRGHFRAGWQHPARRAYRSAYTRWHENAPRDQLRITGTSPVAVPAAIGDGQVERRQLDALFIGEWSSYGGPQKSMIEEIDALHAAGMRVGVLHLEAARFMSTRVRNLCSPIQDRINSGHVAHVLDDEEADVGLAILRYPPLLQFPPEEPFAFSAERHLIVANQAPSERDGSDIRYDPLSCADNAEHVFGKRALWVPQGPTVRGALGAIPANELADFDMPGILDADAWRTERESFRGSRPTVGRHSRDNPMKWPSTAADMISAYPIDGSMDVRMMGGVKSALEVLQRGERPPATWMAIPKDAMPVRTFLNSLDFFVYFQHPHAYDAFGRSVLEALAAGCVAVLPHHMEPTFGDAAVYCDVSEARSVVAEIYSDPARYREQAERAMTRVAERFSHSNYVRLVSDLLSRAS